MLTSLMVLATGLAPASFGYLLDAGVSIRSIALAGAVYTLATVIPLLILPAVHRRRVGVGVR